MSKKQDQFNAFIDSDIDRIFKKMSVRTKEQEFEITNRIRKRIEMKRQEGVTGKSLSRAAYGIKISEEERGEQGIGGGRYIIPRAWEKNVIRQHLIETWWLDRFVKIQHRSQLYMMIKTTQKLVEVANTTNMFELIFENMRGIKEDIHFSPCKLIEGNFAWISKDSKGMYRYFSKREGGNTIGFSIFDLIEIVDGVGIGEKSGFRYAQQELAKLLDLDELRDPWKVAQCEKYLGNLRVLENKDGEFERAFPGLHAFIQTYLPILGFFNNHQEKKIYRSFSYEEEHVFFVSLSHLEDTLVIEKSSVSRSVNLLTLLGLIRKIPHQKLPSRLLGISDQILRGQIKFKRITFYKVPRYNRATLAAAEEMVQKLQAMGFWISRISEERVAKAFGIEKAREVFLPDYKVQSIIAKQAKEEHVEESLPTELLEDDVDYIPF